MACYASLSKPHAAPSAAHLEEYSGKQGYAFEIANIIANNKSCPPHRYSLEYIRGISMLSLAELQQLSQLDFKVLDKTKLVDIRDIDIDPTASAGERLAHFIDKVGNPYMFCVGKVPVRVVFSETAQTLDIAVKNHFVNARTAL